MRFCDAKSRTKWYAYISSLCFNSQPKYTSQHCNQGYAISIDTVKVEMVASRGGGSEGARGLLEDELRALKMAKGIRGG